ncbi:hypothetical protein [Pontimicrobium sp. MEBiC06410]
MKKYLIYIPLALILIIQFYDKNGDYRILQYILLGLMIIAFIAKVFIKKRQHQN